MADPVANSTTTIIDNTDSPVAFAINPQYVNVSDVISTPAYDAVQAIQKSAYKQNLADITSPKWSFSAPFNGTRITVVGAVIPYITGPLPVAQYAVDGRSQNISTVPNSTRALIGVTFYESEWLEPGAHVLTVNVTTATADGPYLFDYLVVSNASAPATSAAGHSTTSVTSSFTSTSASITSSVPDTSNTGAPNTVSAAGSTPPPTGAIVGGVVGGLALVAAIAAAVWWLLRRNQSYGSSSYAYAKTGQYDGPADYVVPFTLQSEDVPPATYSNYSAPHSQHTPSSYSAAPAPDVDVASASRYTDSGSGSAYGAGKASEARINPTAYSGQYAAGPSLSVMNADHTPRLGEGTHLSAATSIPPPYSP